MNKRIVFILEHLNFIHIGKNFWYDSYDNDRTKIHIHLDEGNSKFQLTVMLVVFQICKQHVFCWRI